MAFNLRPYQKTAVEKILDAVNREAKSLVIMATGLGKTVIVAEVIKLLKEKSMKSLFMAHREELINQAIDKIYKQVGWYPEKEKALYRSTGNSFCTVASVQTLRNDRLLSWPPDSFHFITVDEAHHAAALSYKKVLGYFQEYSLLGITATPDRADQKQLGEIFEEIAYKYTLPQAIKDKWLCPIIGKRVKDFEIDLSELKIVAGDYQDKELGIIIEKYIAPIAVNIAEHTRNRKTLIFCPSVESSRLMAETLCGLDIKADFVSGRHDAKSRHNILSQFSRGIISHLCSCDILLEGFDEPTVSSICMLRPTSSRSLYAQAVGRGTRLSEGKDNLLLLEFTFNSDRLKLVEPYELFSDIGFEEQTRRRARSNESGAFIDYLSNLEEAHKRRHDISDILSRISFKKYNVEMFDPIAIADLAGVDLSGEFDIRYKGHKLEGKVTDKQIDILRRYGIYDYTNIDKAQASKLISQFYNNNWSPMIGPATPKQMIFLRQHGYNFSNIPKALASVLISNIKTSKAEGTFSPPEKKIIISSDADWFVNKSVNIF